MNSAEAIAYLAEILRRVRPHRGATYAGLGLLLYRDVLGLPIAPLRDSQPPELPLATIDGIVDALLAHADLSSPYHDGFHLLSLDGHLTHLSHYFAPPIVAGLALHLDNVKHGGRYRAAQYGSCLPGVLASGVLANNYGPVIFVEGAPWLPESGSLENA